jgi:hypothetical protein
VEATMKIPNGVRWIPVALLAGCPPEPTTVPSTTGDTGTPPTDCPAVPLMYEACVETTAPPATYRSSSFMTSTVMEGRGEVLELGGVLPTIAGSEPMQGFEACSTAHTHQLRLLDEGGETWTFGWDLEGTIDDDSLASIEEGATLDFYASWAFLGYSSSGAVLLFDSDGPLFLLELERALDDAQRGGVSVLFGEDRCLTTDDGGQQWEHYQHVVSWTDGSAELWGGQSVVIPLPARSLDFVLGDSSWMVDCADSCGQTWWAGWAEE